MFTLNQAFEALEGRQEFVIKELEDTIAFDYVVVKDDTFSDPYYGWIRRNFRGITFCKHTGDLLSLPFHKFYNINQNVDSQYSDHKNKRASIYEKVDGSMIHFYKKTNGELVASTCRSPESLQAKEAIVFANTDKLLLHYINESIENGCTPCFEWVAPHNQIVVHYKQPRLIYLMSRKKNSGEYLFEDKYGDKVKKFDISFSSILSHTDVKDFEGYVCYLEDGNVFKIKTPWYLERHRSVDLLTRPKYKIYECALNNILDDIIALSPDGHKEVFREVDREVKDDFLSAKLKIEKEFDNLVSIMGDNLAPDYRKNFALEARKSGNFACMMQLLSGKSPDSLIKKELMKVYVQKYPMKVMSS